MASNVVTRFQADPVSAGVCPAVPGGSGWDAGSATTLNGVSVTDPVEYSCQKNFTILATDGQWNTGDESTSTYFGPYNVTSSAYVGQQDSAVDKPYRDASQGTSSGGSSNSLADIAMYYFATDLRTSTLSNCTGAMGVDVCTNNVKTTTRDKAEWQHMTTYTLGMGLSGLLPFDQDYYLENTTSTTYQGLKAGSVNWPIPQSNEASTSKNRIRRLRTIF